MTLLLLFRPRAGGAAPVAPTPDTHDGLPKKIHLPIYEDSIKKPKKRAKKQEIPLEIKPSTTQEEIRERIDVVADILNKLYDDVEKRKGQELTDLLNEIEKYKAILKFLQEEDVTLFMLSILA